MAKQSDSNALFTRIMGHHRSSSSGINTYALYINFSSRDNGPQYEAWDYGTFTGELFVDSDLVLFENYIDIDGDSVDDVSISLTVLGC